MPKLETTAQTIGIDERVKKYWNWHIAAQEYALEKKTCETGWNRFGSSQDTSCAGYHAYFALLDSLGVVSSPYAHKTWYENRLFGATIDHGPEDKPIVVVSGLATPTMAEIAREGSPPEAELRIFDICPTPLAVSKRVLPLKPGDTLFQADARNIDELIERGGIKPKSCSAIVADAFLTRFPEEERLAILKNYTGLLKPESGALITTWRIGSGEKRLQAEHYGTEHDRRLFMKDLAHRAEELGIPLDMDRLGTAYDYAQIMTSYAGQTADEIQAVIEKFFNHVRIEISEPVYDVTMRKYARIFAADSK